MDTCKRRHFLQEIAAAETLAAAEGETQTNGSTAQTGMTGLLGASAGGTGAAGRWDGIAGACIMRVNSPGCPVCVDEPDAGASGNCHSNISPD